ncbi:MAG TPA: F0F1 ATP synthase subunit A [Gemmatimonadota bacterium]|nr:F0F1 ATP synthase subunit A [Gemmatimonadota bacterium]
MPRPLLSTFLIGATVMAFAAFPADSAAASVPVSVASVQEATVQESDPEHADEDAHEWGTETMMHHIIDSNEIDLPFLEPIHLPQWEPIRAGPLVIDMSPTKHTVFLWIATLLTILTVWIAARRFSREDQAGEAPKGFLNFFEAFYEYLRDEVALANIGHGGERFVPYVVTLFFFILYANLLGLVPYGATATSNIMVTGALAIISLVIVEAAGFAALGPKGYLGTIFYVPKGLPKPMVPIMLIIMTPVEIIGKLAKPFALAVRLFANMTAGHFVILALLGLILTYGGANLIGGVSIVGALALGLFVMFLEIFVAFLQAYIFTILTAVFIGLIRHAH